MKIVLSLLLPLGLSACLLSPGWHWAKSGATDEERERDIRLCKQASYSGTDGNVTQASVRRMQGCMEMRGWRRQDD